MSHRAEHTRYLAQRLRRMGVRIEHEAGRRVAEGELALAGAPFETLANPMRIRRARFYTLGYNRIKFYHPLPLFSLPAVEVGHCESKAQVESALRRAWAGRLRGLREAARWAERLGAGVETGEQGTQLLLPLTGLQGPPARLHSPVEIQLPSSGPLENISLAGPTERRHRPTPGLQHSSDLEIEVSQLMSRLAQAAAAGGESPEGSAPGPAPGDQIAFRVLVIEPDRPTLTATETLLRTRGHEVDGFQDPERGLRAFEAHSYEIVLAAASMTRGDGLELTSLVRSLPGLEQVPVVLTAERFTRRQRREAADLEVNALFETPLSWPEIGPILSELLAHPTRRRFRRVRTVLPVETESAGEGVRELTEEISRRGFRLRTPREISPDSVERYRILLPEPFEPITVEGQVISCITLPGQASLRAGVRILRFLHSDEAAWIRLVGNLLGECSEKEDPPESP